jgi:hypothetical protein
MSKADEDRAQRRFADNMREASTRAKADAAASEARKKQAKKTSKRQESSSAGPSNQETPDSE